MLSALQSLTKPFKKLRVNLNSSMTNVQTTGNPFIDDKTDPQKSLERVIRNINKSAQYLYEASETSLFAGNQVKAVLANLMNQPQTNMGV